MIVREKLILRKVELVEHLPTLCNNWTQNIYILNTINKRIIFGNTVWNIGKTFRSRDMHTKDFSIWTVFQSSIIRQLKCNWSVAVCITINFSKRVTMLSLIVRTIHAVKCKTFTCNGNYRWTLNNIDKGGNNNYN